MRVMSKRGHPGTLRRPLQHIYSLEVHCEPTDGDTASVEPNQDVASGKPEMPSPTPASTTGSPGLAPVSGRPTQKAATQARDRILGCAIEDSYD